MARPDTSIRIYTANRDGASVLAFKATASGNVAPAIHISGSKTTLDSPDALSLDAAGNIYTANDSGTQVVVFAAGAHGNVKPSKTIGGSNSHLGPTEGILVDPSGNLWVTNYSGGAISRVRCRGTRERFAHSHHQRKPNNAGDSAGNRHGCKRPGCTWRARGTPRIAVFKGTANGNVKPVFTIAGATRARRSVRAGFRSQRTTARLG